MNGATSVSMAVEMDGYLRHYSVSAPEIHRLWRHGSIVAGASGADVILIDIPIGLLESGTREHQCDYHARRQPGVRRASVFPAPLP